MKKLLLHTSFYLLTLVGLLATPPAALAAPDFFMRSSISPNDPFVQSQATYTAKIYYNRNINNPILTPPHAKHAQIETIGRNKNFRETIDNKVYEIVVLKYAVFPQQSGDLVIQPPVIEGSVLETKRYSDNATHIVSSSWQPIRVTGKPLSLFVRAKPASYHSSWWLPASDVKVEEYWSQSPPHFRVGQALTRTLSIQATGTTAEQLPQLSPKSIRGFQLYPDRPVNHTNTDHENVTAQRIEKIAMIPEHPGHYTLPGITVTWWDTKSNRLRTTKLPGRKVQVLTTSGTATTHQAANHVTPLDFAPAKGSGRLQSPKGKATNSPSAKPASGTTHPSTQPSKPINNDGQWHNPLTNPWLWTTIVAVGLWLFTLFTQRRASTITGAQQADAIKKQQALSAQRKQLRKQAHRACTDNNPANAKAAVIAWARSLWPHRSILNLNDLAHQVKNPDCRLQLQELNRLIYTDQPIRWDGQLFWTLISQEFKSQAGDGKNSRRNNGDKLPPLYPDI